MTLLGCTAVPAPSPPVDHKEPIPRPVFEFIRTEVPGELLPPPNKNDYIGFDGETTYTSTLIPYMNDLRHYNSYISVYIDDLTVYLEDRFDIETTSCDAGEFIIPTLPPFPVKPTIPEHVTKSELWNLQLRYNSALKRHTDVITKLFEESIREYNKLCE